MHTAFRYTCSHGIVLFLFLIAFAMVQMSSMYVFLPLIFLAVALFVLSILGSVAYYLRIALTICKNE